MITEIFARRKPDFEKLRLYGFIKDKSGHSFSVPILDGAFTLTVRVSQDGGVETELLDEATGEPYTLYLVEEAAGEFVGSVREAVRRALCDIAERCFDSAVFRESNTQTLLAFVREKYGDEPEYLWEKFPGNAVLRRKDNRKWYAAILTAERKKVGLKGEGKIELLDLRADPAEVALLINGVTVLPAYHMNKKHWLSLPLDGAVPLAELLERLEESWFIAGQR